jgi:hypothetical protein
MSPRLSASVKLILRKKHADFDPFLFSRFRDHGALFAARASHRTFSPCLSIRSGDRPLV